MKSWDQAGLWGNDSALVWAQRSDQSILGTYSWVTARDSYYQALTTGSETEFATTFRSLGQVMHLVSDMAVPAHVRNDPHPFSDPYEDWTTVNQNDLPYENYYPVKLTIFSNHAPSATAPLPISTLWDKDIYDGSNPDALWSLDAGLAEFTNANFLSRDTFGKYPHPNFADPGLLYEVKWHDRPTIIAEDNSADSPAYIWRLVGGQQKYRLAAANYFAIETDDGLVSGFGKTLDDEVNRDYAGELIPRAIGYSTVLLDYFFRGDIDLKPESAGGYSLANNTSENMTGTFALYYDDTSGTRRKLPGGEWLSTTVAANGRIPIESIAIPADHAVPAKYFLVFKGKMGGESGAVAGRVVSLKPPVVMVLKLNGQLYSPSGNFKFNSSPLYLMWDVYNSKTLTVKKTGGGVWLYPLTAGEYNGQFLNDLETMNGGPVSIITTTPLLSRDYGWKPMTDIRNPLYGSALSPSGARLYYSWQNQSQGRSCRDPSDRPLAPYNDTTTYGISATSKSAVNNVGIEDTWTETATSKKVESDTRGVSLNSDGGYYQWSWDDLGAFTTRRESTHSLSFHAPFGGILPILHLGYKTGFISATNKYNDLIFWDGTATAATRLPPPTTADSARLMVRNYSNAPPKVIGAAVDYTGNLTFSEYHITEYHGCDNRATIHTGSSTTANGFGEVRGALGGVASVAYNFSESGALEKSSGDNTFVWPYTGSRSVDYAKTALDISSAFDSIENSQAIILIESFESGHAAVDILPPTPPLKSSSKATESSITYTNLKTSYNTKTVCQIVNDSNTQNPWLLSENSTLKGELDRTISTFIDNNQTDGDNHWLLSTTIDKVVW